MKFSKTKLSVINTMNSLQSNYGYNGVQNVHCQRSQTLAVEYATDNHAMRFWMIKWKVRQCCFDKVKRTSISTSEW